MLHAHLVSFLTTFFPNMGLLSFLLGVPPFRGTSPSSPLGSTSFISPQRFQLFYPLPEVEVFSSSLPRALDYFQPRLVYPLLEILRSRLFRPVSFLFFSVATFFPRFRRLHSQSRTSLGDLFEFHDYVVAIVSFYASSPSSKRAFSSISPLFCRVLRRPPF